MSDLRTLARRARELAENFDPAEMVALRREIVAARRCAPAGSEAYYHLDTACGSLYYVRKGNDPRRWLNDAAFWLDLAAEAAA